MALQSLFSRLPRKGFLGSSSNGVGNMNISDSGSWTSPLLLPWRISHAKDVKILPSFAPMNYAHQSGNPSQRYQLGGAHDLPDYLPKLVLQAAATFCIEFFAFLQAYLHPPPETLTFINLSLYGDDQLRVYAGTLPITSVGVLFVCLSVRVGYMKFFDINVASYNAGGTVTWKLEHP